MRRAIENGIDPATWLRRHRDVRSNQKFSFVDEQIFLFFSKIRWAESQVPKSRQKREFVLNDPQWNNMWYLVIDKKHFISNRSTSINSFRCDTRKILHFLI